MPRTACRDGPGSLSRCRGRTGEDQFRFPLRRESRRTALAARWIISPSAPFSTREHCARESAATKEVRLLAGSDANKRPTRAKSVRSRGSPVPIRSSLPLGVLRSLAGALETDFLPLLDSRVASQQAEPASGSGEALRRSAPEPGRCRGEWRRPGRKRRRRRLAR